MIKLDPMDGENRVYLHPQVDLLELLEDSEAAAITMKYTHDLRCFCNYLVAHYHGTWNFNHTKFQVYYPLQPY